MLELFDTLCLSFPICEVRMARTLSHGTVVRAARGDACTCSEQRWARVTGKRDEGGTERKQRGTGLHLRSLRVCHETRPFAALPHAVEAPSGVLPAVARV